jgi:hypothetical protein
VASVDLEEKVRDNPKFKFMRAIKLNNLWETWTVVLSRNADERELKAILIWS